MVAEAAGHAVFVFPGDAANFKLTTPEDFVRAQEQLKALAASPICPICAPDRAMTSTPSAEGDQVWLGGVARSAQPWPRRPFGRRRARPRRHRRRARRASPTATSARISRPSDPQWKGAASVDLSGPRGQARARARRHDRPCRRDHGLRSAQDRPASRRDPGKPRADHGARRRPRGGEGDDDRAAGLYRPAARVSRRWRWRRCGCRNCNRGRRRERHALAPKLLRQI